MGSSMTTSEEGTLATLLKSGQRRLAAPVLLKAAGLVYDLEAVA